MTEKQMKSVLIATVGTFRLSNAAIAGLARLKGKVPMLSLGDETRLMGWGNPEDETEEPFVAWTIKRDDPDLITVFTELGPETALPGTTLKLCQVPADQEWFVYEDRTGENVGFHPEVKP